MTRLALWLPLVWLALFFALPFAIVAGIAPRAPMFAQPPYGPLIAWEDGLPRFAGDLAGMLATLTDPLYLDALLASIVMAGQATGLAALIGLPMAYVIARAPERWRPLLLLGVILPFWTSFLMRIYAWMELLRDGGLINHLLMSLGLTEAPLRLLNTDGAVLVGLVYSYLPFMVLPLYAAFEKLDWRLLEAAMDLGCRPLGAFWRITLPLALPGLLVGCLLVFIPTLGEVVVPALLGGPDTTMIGKLLWEEFFSARNWPGAAALALLILAVLALPMALLGRAEARLDTNS